MPRRVLPHSSTPATLAQSTALSLIEAARRASEALERALAPLQLRPRHYRVLVALAETGPLSQQRLGGLLDIDRTTMVAIVDELERQGLAERHPDAEDRRSYRVQLTSRGRTTLVRATGAVARTDEAILANLDAAERQQLQVSLTRLLDRE
jgi:DNA-binding MarR family transcriptional regulator